MDDDRLKELGGGGYFRSYWKESVTSGLLKGILSSGIEIYATSGLQP